MPEDQAQAPSKFSKAYYKLAEYSQMTNIAEELDEDLLKKIGGRVVDDYDVDEDSRSEWKEQTQKYIELAKLVAKEKSFPWPGASNVMVPIVANAAIKFAARAYPEIIRGHEVVKGQITGRDQDGAKAERAKRIGTHMSYQLTEEMEEWETDTDKLLHALPIVGHLFRKEYFCPLEQRTVSELRFPDKLVVNNGVQSLKKARRITDVLDFHHNDVEERTRAGLWLKVKLNPEQKDDQPQDEKYYCFLEQHRWWDLDGDGYEEPYVITVHKDSRKVVRIVANFDMESVKVNQKGQISKIDCETYFTDYGFIPNFDGGFYHVGFGRLIGPLNQTINTLINQLIDAGTLSNVQGGYIDRRIQMPKGRQSFQPGEWKQVNSSGVRLSEGVYPLPTKEPSAVLLNLMMFLLDQANELASVKDVLSGETPGANVPATTVMAMIEQGMKTFNAIYKRIYRSLKKEFKCLYKLNSKYLPEEQYYRVLDEEQVVFRQDYAVGDCDVQPVADPTVSTDVQRLAKAQAIYQMKGDPNVDQYEASKFYVEAIQVPNVDKFVPPPQPQQTPPEVMKMQAEMEAKGAELDLKAQELDRKERELALKELETREKILEIRSKTIRNLADAEAKEAGTQIDAYTAQSQSLLSFTQQQQRASNERENQSGRVPGMGESAGNGGGAQLPVIPDQTAAGFPDPSGGVSIPGGSGPETGGGPELLPGA